MNISEQTELQEMPSVVQSNSQVGGEEFYSALQEKAQAAVASIFNSPLYTIQYPSQGDFMWNWQNINQTFNESTYNYINARISPGDIANTAKLGSEGSFPNAYVQLLNSIKYTLNTADAGKVKTAQLNASQQAATVVSNYQATFGTITEAQMKEVDAANKWDYVTGYILGFIWSGRNEAGEKPLSYTEMSKARNLKKLMPNMPASGDQTLTDVSLYLNLMGGVTAFLDSLQFGAWVITSLKNNAQYPDETNNGMKTVNPNTGAVSDTYNVGYGINYPTSSISNDLQNKGRTIEVKMETATASGSSMNVKVEGQAGFSIGSWLKFGVSGGGSYDMSKSEGTSENCSVTMKWEGYSMVPSSPSAWQQATNKGWYFADPIKQAIDSEGQDISGYSFVITPPFNMGKFVDGGDFGMLNNILIANYPTIEITYSNANFSSFKESWDQHSSGNLTLFGFIKLGSFSEGVYQSSYKEGSDNSSFTVKFSASPAIVGVPELQQTAYVIGGAITNPGT